MSAGSKGRKAADVSVEPFQRTVRNRTERFGRWRPLTGMTPLSKTTRWFIIGFAIVEAALITWALLSARIH